MVKNNVIGHDENPAFPFYSGDGDDAAANGNVMVSSSATTPDTAAIDMWMTGPFHAIGILDPALTQTGFGSHREAGGGYQMGGCLDVLRGLGTIPAGTTFPIRWPRAGGSIPFLSYNGNEFPNPLTSCPGYTAPTGPPIMIQIGPGNVTPQVTAHLFMQGNTQLVHCVYDETSYINPNGSEQSFVRSILNIRDAIVLIPKSPLISGATYTVSITTNGQVHTYSFVARPEDMPIDSVGVFRPSTRQWYTDLNRDDAWSGCTQDDCMGPFGASSDVALVGDWNGNGITGVGTFRPADLRWRLDSNGDGMLNACGTDTCLGPFGLGGDKPVVGDWTGNRKSKIGVFRSSTGRWYLDRNGDGLWSGCGVDTCSGPFGNAGDQVIAGDWDGNGKAKIGVFRSGAWYLDRNGDGLWSGCGADTCTSLGVAGDKPVAGDWNGSGTTKIGIFRPSTQRWYLDRNGDNLWSGCAIDICAGAFGSSTDQPVAGAW
jgi:hypothetical protein